MRGARRVAWLVALLATGARAATGDAMPQFDLPLLAGGYVNTVDLAGHVAVVDFWTAACMPCRDALPAYQALVDAYGAQGFTVLAINMDETRDAADATVAELALGFPVAWDADGETAVAFGLRGMPSAFLVGCDGTVRREFMGYHERVDAPIRAALPALLKEPACGVPAPSGEDDAAP